MIDLSTFVLAAGVCMLAIIACTLLVSLSLKLYTEIMKEKVISSRAKLEHKCTCNKAFLPVGGIRVPDTKPPIVEVSPPTIKRVALREAIIIAQKFMRTRKNRRG